MIVTLFRDGREIARYLKARSFDDVREYVRGFGSLGEWKGAYMIRVESEGEVPTYLGLTRKGNAVALIELRL